MKRNPEEAPVHRDISAPVQFSQPVVAPGVTDPSALRYARGLQERHGVPSGRYATPVAGGPTPSIPRLDAAAAVGVSMADQAAMHRAAAEGPAPGPIAPSSGIFQGPPPPSRSAPPPARGPAPIPVLPGDILPDEAMKDPEYRQGQGSRYASSQPQLALKYGVIRNGKRIPPQQLSTVPKGLKPETLEGLKAIQDAQRAREQVESPDAKVEQEAADGVAGAAGRLGNSPTDGPQVRTASEAAALETLKKMDDFDYSTFREMMMKDIINNDDQRKIIEKRCKPMDLTDIVTAGFVTQRVPVVPDKFEPEFQSMRSDEDLAIKRLIMLENKGLEVTERYLLDKFSVMGVTIGLRSINGTLLPTHLDVHGKFHEELFWKKFDFVARLPFHMVASIGVNYYWFDLRVRRLFVADALGNG